MVKIEIDISRYKHALLYTYSLSHLKVKDKVRFYYALKGRDGKTGIIKYLKIEQLGKTVLLVDVKYEKEMDEFFKLWKCRYKLKKILIEK